MIRMILAVLTGWMASGCVVYEMRDQLTETNRQLLEMQQALVRTEEGVEVMSRKLEMTNDLLLDVRDGLGTTNDLLSDVRERLGMTNELLTSVRDSLGTTNKSLSSVHDGLGTTSELVATSNQQVTVLQGQLEQTNQRYLESMEAMILRLDEHLISLRETVADMTRFMPFVDGQRSPDGEPERTGPRPPDGDR